VQVKLAWLDEELSLECIKLQIGGQPQQNVAVYSEQR